MAFSIEARVPHLSNGTIDLGLRLPPRWQVRGGWTKYALRCAMKGILPEEILWDRFKLGFAVPQGRWVERSRNEITAWLNELPAGVPVNVKSLIAGIDRGLGNEPWFWKAISVGLWMRFMNVEV